MTYEEYKNLLLEKNNEIVEIKKSYAKSLNEKYKDYIDKIVILPEKNRITDKKAYFKGFYYESNFYIKDVVPLFLKIKKDGSMSNLKSSVSILSSMYDNLNIKLYNPEED